MAEKKLSEELRHCLEGNGCAYCTCYEAKSVLTCRGLLQKAYEVVKRYEEMFPCKVGDIVYWVNDWFYDGKIGLNHKNHITESKVSRFIRDSEGVWIKLRNGENIPVSDFGKIVFLTKEAAKKALKEMEDRKNVQM